MPIKCETCGMEYPEWPGKFCDRCGRALERLNVEPEEDEGNYQKCGKCGHRNPEDSRVCDNCGELLHTPRIS